MTALNDATVLITGANGGLGTEFVRQALSRGAARVYATARHPRAWDDERVVGLALDVTSAESIRAAAAAASDTSVVVNNAGISVPGARVLDTPIDEVRRLFDTNVFGALQVAQIFAPVLAANGGGALVDIHSALSWLARGGAYAASKAAFWSLTNSLRTELLAQGTQVVGAHLGYTDTPFIAELDVPKEDPADIVRVIYDGLERGDHEVLADDTSRNVKAALAAPLEVLYPELAAG
ncbi:SDR family oxidoreductase [Microbacterium sp.]|uniref:SDR family oxidoreductase n=1 Tax=Microbacterium sp. TaxID=51671 RepID=UPI00092AFE71|nr:SDR family oxidoreductase [Microbacterium sp.]MBN9187160.1 SDR family oxidoreductase [Microbacterium sp.]MBN9193776.1 SDR family oxidoreductase [Microbacterium sp.]OJU66303.1 MAG: short-chain dehydrogenase [Microbacterium sp. 70-38]